MSESRDPSAFDIAIVGGGLVGASLACALDRLGIRVALVESAAGASAAPPSFDERNLALAAASLNALEALGVLRRLATPPAPIRRIHITRAGDFGAVRLDANDYGREAFGGVVVARDLGNALEARLGELRHLTRLTPAIVVAVETGEDAHRVTLERGGERESIAARLLVAADGTRSFVRDALGIGADEEDYGQTLFVCTVAAERAPQGMAWERFTHTGPVALLPRPDGHYGAVLGVSSEEAGTVAALDDAAYLDLLQSRIGGRPGRLIRVGKRSRYPIRRVLAERLVAPRAVVMGNAAQTIHPIGAQGFNLGLRDALTLAELLEDGGDPGEPQRLARYPELRREDRERTLAFSDGLARLTANPTFPMHVLRSLGLLALDRLPGLKAPLVSGAMGFRGATPRLARGGGA